MRKIQHNLVPALLAAVIAALVIIPIFGLELKRAGMTMGLESHWSFVLWGSLAVFIVQLFKPALQARTAGLGLSLPKLPSLPAQWAKPLMFAALLMAVTWPFFAGRNAIDIATLALIYVMLGLGLNVVVGFAGLLDLGFVGFYAVGAYTYALLFHWADWSFWQALPLAGAMAALFGFLLGFSGAALARRLFGDCDLGLWRNHSPAAGEPDRLDRRPRWYFWHSQTHGDGLGDVPQCQR